MGNLTKGISVILGALAAAEAAGTAYFYRRTMMRSNTKTERTMKMSGTDWEQYFPLIEERKAHVLKQPHRDVWITSDDGFRLHGVYFPGKETEKTVICFHGYTSQCMSDFIGLSDYYLKRGYRMFLGDQRAHGEYIGFGCKDRYDAKKWIQWMIGEAGEGCRILLHGISMGGATVLMTSGLKLPYQVKGIISDCVFTSPKEVFTHMLRTMYHLPAFPMLAIADRINRKKAGYGLDDCNAAREVRKAQVPILLIHGEKDTFVPCEMCTRIYENCASSKKKLVIKGAGHAESYYMDILKGISLGAVLYINDSLMRVAKNIKLFKPEMMLMVPLMIEVMAKKLGEVSGLPDKLVKNMVFGKQFHTICSGGAYLNPDDIDLFDRYGITVLQGYGMTECSPVISTSVSWNRKKESVGQLIPNCEAKVVDEELWVKGSSVMMGYYKMPEETAKPLKDGWLKTGDLGYVDREGFVYLTGRKKNLIITKNGENISPEELKNKLSASSLVKEILVRDRAGVIEVEIFPDYDYMKKKRIHDEVSALQGIIDEYNRQAPLQKRIYSLKIRETEFEKTTSRKIKRY